MPVATVFCFGDAGGSAFGFGATYVLAGEPAVAVGFAFAAASAFLRAALAVACAFLRAAAAAASAFFAAAVVTASSLAAATAAFFFAVSEDLRAAKYVCSFLIGRGLCGKIGNGTTGSSEKSLSASTVGRAVLVLGESPLFFCSSMSTDWPWRNA